MDYLTLCKEVAADAGTIAGFQNVTTVVGLSGRPAKLVGWVRDAWIDIQNERNDWSWMRRRFGPVAMTAGVDSYTATAFGISRFGEWLQDRSGFRTFAIYDPDQGTAQTRAMDQISYDSWIERWGRGDHPSQMPVEWAISPTREILVGPKPDKAYMISGEYRISPQELSADGDVPEMPAQYHRVIIPRAIRLASSSDEAWNSLQDKTNQYGELRSALVREQTPTPSMW